jgi:hypothetical protein
MRASSNKHASLSTISEQAEENRLRKEDELRQKREEESKKDEEKMKKKEEEKARREAILQQFRLKKELDNNDDVRPNEHFNLETGLISPPRLGVYLRDLTWAQILEYG